MKNDKKPNSIATMSKEELQEVNGGRYLIRYPDVFPIGVPAPLWNQGVSGMNSGIINQGMMNQGMIR